MTCLRLQYMLLLDSTLLLVRVEYVCTKSSLSFFVSLAFGYMYGGGGGVDLRVVSHKLRFAYFALPRPCTKQTHKNRSMNEE